MAGHFHGVRFHTRLKKTSPSVQCVFITTLPAMPVYMQPILYPQAQRDKLHIYWRTYVSVQRVQFEKCQINRMGEILQKY